MKFDIDYFVYENNLREADAIIVKKPGLGLLKHYVIYLGIEKGKHTFIANYTRGVRILSEIDLAKFLEYLIPTNIRRFIGNELQRMAAVSRALSRLGEDTYNLLFNNCEHFSNWVQEGIEESNQTQILGGSMIAGGLGMTVAGAAAEKKGLVTAGLVTTGLGLLTFLIDELSNDKGK